MLYSEIMPEERTTTLFWISYRWSDLFEIICSKLTTTRPTRLGDLYFASKNAPSGAAFHEELMTCLFELKICYDNECFAACMALCGKILEIALKRYFDAESIPYGSKDMLGALIQTYRTHRGPSLPHKHIAEVSTIINEHRIGAVHAKSDAMAPNRDQVVMVIHCTADALSKSALNTTIGRH